MASKRDSSASSSIRDSLTSASRFSSLLSPSSTSSLTTISSSSTATAGGGGVVPGGGSTSNNHGGSSRVTSLSGTPSSGGLSSFAIGLPSLPSVPGLGSSSSSNVNGTSSIVGAYGSNGSPITTTRRMTLIYDRPITKTRGSEISLGAWSYLLAEIVQYTQKRVSGIGELNILGYRIGVRLLELLPLRDHLHPLSSRSPPPPTRTLRLLPILTYVHSIVYRYLFNRPADSLERSTENSDEYMIGDNDMVLTRNIEVPKEMSELSCAALVAGIIEAVLDGAGFPSRVTAHSVPTLAHPRKTVILIKLAPEVLKREAALDGT
ncbi:BZ3500_MvSof-1268-A1-R1_Chr1-1g01075 [Microbotryum saponariae]|uniref:BZ3500_MvSof-1268-A1-R1_Chr1-1g01075 protein n=1 Tax=Microbotryum saponariae TaxID=289078 RepID=A0A2X0KF09_9BASI|nr:BZ3500_MvSof-1268-A1-R1_Chr1-1g01075 [Microbotryum saponariae]SCZ93360.1 BZ3501_MvSof-1269-A2-R1_Chr1-1g00672 [Microbotryum saponariae]